MHLGAVLFFRFLLLFVLSNFSWTVHAQSAPKMKFCFGEFALCAASTGVLTGGTVRVKNSDGQWQVFPETRVMCPIMNGTSVSATNINQMNNSCKAPKGMVYSTYWDLKAYPQEALNWETGFYVPQICQPQPTQGGKTQKISQCWAMLCQKTNTYTPSGIQLAACSCAYGEFPLGGFIDPSDSTTTGAGHGNSDACSQNPVAAAIPNTLPPQR